MKTLSLNFECIDMKILYEKLNWKLYLVIITKQPIPN